MSTKVSIIIPVFNSKKYISQCIESVLKINFNSYDIIIVDNCSTDGSLDLIRQFKSKKIKIIKNTKNFGQTYSLNKGIKISNSKYIAIMDSDDICLPNRIKSSYEFLENKKSFILVGGKSNTIDSDGNLLKKRFFSTNEIIIKNRLFLENPISHTTIMFDRKKILLLGGYTKKYNYSQDLDLYNKIISNGYRINNLNEHFTLVRKHPLSQSNKNQTIQQKEKLKIIQNNIKRYKGANKIIHIRDIEKLLFNKNDSFNSMTNIRQVKLFSTFIDYFFSNKDIKIYIIALLFSQKNHFKKFFKFKIIYKYVLINKFKLKFSETKLRLFKSILKIIF